MRLGVIADIHGNAPALHAALATLEGRCDALVFAGDLAGYYPFVNESADMLARSRLIAGVVGNHDVVLRDCLAAASEPDDGYVKRYGSALTRASRNLSPVAKGLLDSWSPSTTLLIDGVRVMVAHGTPWDPVDGRVYPDFSEWDRFEPYDAAVFLLGHTHYQLVHPIGDRLVVNPGSVGQARDTSGAAAFAIVDIPSRRVECGRVTYDASRLLDDARVNDPGLRYLTEVLTR